MIASTMLTLNGDRARALAKVWELNAWVEGVVLRFAALSLRYKPSRKKLRIGMVDKLPQGDESVNLR